MIENKKIQKYLLIVTIMIIIIEILIFFLREKYIIMDIIYNVLLGIIGSAIVSYIIAIITYNYKKEEKQEELIKNLLEIYLKMIIFKCSYNECSDKNQKIIELQEVIDKYIASIHEIEYDFVYKLKIIDKKDTIVLNRYTEKSVNVIAEGLEFENNKFINKAKGLKNQKEFIESYNKLLDKIRIYLEKFCVEKYEIQYNLLKKIDSRYEDVKSNSNRKIKYNNIK